jgi:hypothetical protein
MAENNQFLIKAVSTALDSDFSQFSVLTADDFERYCNERDILVDVGDLEYFDEVGLLSPIAWLRKTAAPQGSRQKYSGVFLGAEFLRRYMKNGMLRFPERGRFKPWIDYKDGYEFKELPLYHRYQIFELSTFFQGTRMIMSPQSIHESMDTKFLAQWRDHLIKILSKHEPERSKKTALLVQLETPYLPGYREQFQRGILDLESLSKWNKWKEESFSVSEVLDRSGLSIDQVRDFRDTVAVWGQSVDPLEDWYMLVRLFTFEARRRLKGKAQLAQDYYEMAGLLNSFIHDLTGESARDPDDITDVGGGGSWKEKWYGPGFSYDRKDVQKKILDRYLKTKLPKAVLFIEGYTEDEVITRLMPDLPYIGIDVFNYEGFGGLRQSSAHKALETWKHQAIRRFVLMDNDEGNKEYMAELVERGLVDADDSHLWDSDFEEDNFGVQRVVEAISKMLEIQGWPPITAVEVEEERKQGKLVLMRAIRQAYRRKQHENPFNYVSKVALAKDLIAPRLSEISTERPYSPRLPIEKFLTKMVSKST